jgi:hypothetical protein
LEEDADQANLPPTRPVSKPEEGELPASERAEAEVIVEHQNRLYRLAELNPRGAIIEAWVLVESALRQAAKEAQLDITAHTSTNRVLNLLRQREVVSPQVLKLLDQLRVLRNYAAHERDLKTSTEEVINYIDVSLRVSNALRQPFFQDGEADNR